MSMGHYKRLMSLLVLAFLASSFAYGQGNDVCTKRQGDRTLVVDMKVGQRYFLNMDPHSAQQMPGVLAKVMAGRSERVVFLVVRKQVSYVELQKFEDAVFKSVPGVKIGLILDDAQTCVAGQPSGPATALEVLMPPR